MSIEHEMAQMQLESFCDNCFLDAALSFNIANTIVVSTFFNLAISMSIFECFCWVLAFEQRYLAEIILTQLTIKVPNFGPKNSNFACKSQIFRISFQKMLRSLGLGLGLETFAKFLRVSVSKNLVSEKKSRFQNFGIVIQW